MGIAGVGHIGGEMDAELLRQLDLLTKMRLMKVEPNPHRLIDWDEMERMTKDPELLNAWWEREAQHWRGI